MQELEIGICGMFRVEGLMHPPKALALAFYQIAQLKNLESLVLSVARNVNSVSIDLKDRRPEGMGIGLLKHLRGLTRLRELTIVDPQTTMAGDILDSVVDIWPGLSGIGFSLEPERIYDDADRYLRMNHPHLKRISTPRATCLFDNVYFS
ncbi:hypothetical protein EDD21DRAFT_385512 [Dissophora ornata]|nr:hypothetical protein EDD21DRAFT_385512 [Dissophora ornata]